MSNFTRRDAKQLGETAGFTPETQCVLEYIGHSPLPVTDMSALGKFQLLSQRGTKRPFCQPEFSPKFQLHSSHSC